MFTVVGASANLPAVGWRPAHLHTYTCALVLGAPLNLPAEAVATHMCIYAVASLLTVAWVPLFSLSNTPLLKTVPHQHEPARPETRRVMVK